MNEEYQRGAEWGLVQKQRLIDSVLRGYALPMFYLRRVSKADLDGNLRSEAEVIDGQQRLRALAEFRQNAWPALEAKDPKLSVPDSIRQSPCPWGGRTFGELTKDLQEIYDKTTLTVVVIGPDAADDEIRDLFIRLQAGTALTRQQVRDAWPGNAGPFIVKLAGKGKSRPKYRLFSQIGQWGKGGDTAESGDEDAYHEHRQTCAQLLWLFHRRWDAPSEFPSLHARSLDELYHTMVDLSEDSEEIRAFEQVLVWCDRIVGREYYKLRKLEMFSLFLFLCDLQAAREVPLEQEIPKIQKAFATRSGKDEPATAGKRLTSGPMIAEFYEWFVRVALSGLQIAGLDDQRLFSDDQKRTLWEGCKDERGQARCGVCIQPVVEDDVEYDHVRPWIRGGRTSVENGRVVHKSCHLRGRPAAAYAR